MFNSLTLENFKSFAGDPQTISFAPVTVFVGANGSGKSNVFDAIRFLQGLGMGLSINEILTGKWEGGRDVHPGLRGGIEEVCWRGETAFEISSRIFVVNSPDLPQARDVATGETYPTLTPNEMYIEPFELQHTIGVAMDRSPSIVEEALVREPNAPTESLLFEGSFHNDLKIRWANRHWQELSQNTQRASSTTLLLLTRQLAGMQEWPTIVSFLQAIADSQFLNLRPSAMRDYVHATRPMLGEFGENLSAIVHRLCADEEQKNQFVEWVGALCAPQIVDVDFDKTEFGDVLAYLVESNGTTANISVKSLSDGTLRFMALLAALLTAPERSVFLLEEIENGLHPTRVHLLVELLEQVAEARNIQIIATTHSSQVLLSLSGAALRDTVLFARDDEHPGTIVRRLGDLPDFEDVTQRQHIDELFTTGWLERAV